jgi:DNA polymerase-3 subunit chi
MGASYFYQLTETPLEAALPQLLTRALGAGWRIAVRGRSAEFLDQLDQRLWLGPEEGFLPHGMAGGPHDAEQPVLLTSGAESPNGAVCVMAVESADVSAEEVKGLERVCVIFDGADQAALDHARGQWKALTDAGCEAQYWAQDGGRWVKKAEKAAS